MCRPHFTAHGVCLLHSITTHGVGLLHYTSCGPVVPGRPVLVPAPTGPDAGGDCRKNCQRRQASSGDLILNPVMRPKRWIERVVTPGGTTRMLAARSPIATAKATSQASRTAEIRLGKAIRQKRAAVPARPSPQRRGWPAESCERRTKGSRARGASCEGSAPPKGRKSNGRPTIAGPRRREAITEPNRSTVPERQASAVESGRCRFAILPAGQATPDGRSPRGGRSREHADQERPANFPSAIP